MDTLKWKLANWILIETEALKECQSVSGSLALAELMTRDAMELARIIKEEEEIKQMLNQEERRVA